MAHKKSGSGIAALLLLGLIAVLASIPKEIWIAIGVVLAIGLIVFVLGKLKTVERGVSTGKSVAETAPLERAALSAADSEVPRQYPSSSSHSVGFRIPAPPPGLGVARWYGPGETLGAGGRQISGGMVYVGRSLICPAGDNDPCLIDPSKSVLSSGNFRLRQTGYWPSYADISASARAAYLDWLADGRRDPQADIGYVFIFFYGLERRVLIDFDKDASAKADLSAIRDELTRLLGIYGPTSASFKGYATNLLTWMQLSEVQARLYEKPLIGLPRGYELPMQLRVALGQVAVDGVPLPAQLALSWVRLAPDLLLRMPASRCTEEFDQCFLAKYREKYGEGMLLRRNRTKLRFAYRPASAGFRGHQELRLDFGELPDVTAVTGPIKTLGAIADEVTDELGPYSRFLGRNPDARGSLEALLQLPPTLWPDSALQTLREFKARMGEGMILMSCRELLERLKARAALGKDRFVALARALELQRIGLEPDVLGGARLPKPDSKIVLFSLPSDETPARATPAYQTAVLTLQLASAVAIADGKFDGIELAFLSRQVKSWTHLSPNLQRRLMAQLRLLGLEPMSLAAVKRKLEPLEHSSRVTIAAFMATVAQADGTVTPAEIKILEKIYLALGVEQQQVFTDVHAAATGAASADPQKSERTGFRLDPARISALQQDSKLAAALLANIFSEEAVDEPSPSAAAEEQDVSSSAGLFGLDQAHSALARLLLSHAQWSRAELQDAAADLELMLDGALEQINDVCFDKFAMPLIEGDDPMTVNSDLLEKIAA